jgi:glycosyltransferase involved in cell wall biosynthesis
MHRGHTISVVIPCYNEEEGIGLTLADMPALVDEVVVVDNNCTDRTAEIATSHGARVLAEKRPGYGAAYKAGFAAATGDVIVTMDGDDTYPRGFIPVLLDVLIDEHLDFITCDRTGHKSEEANSFLRVLGNFVLNLAVLGLYFFWLNDSQSGMWVFRRAVLPRLRLTSDGMSLSEEIKVEAFRDPEIRAKELPIYYRERVGQSKLNLWADGWYNLVFLFRKRFGIGL